MVDVARASGANFAGSGGAIVGTCEKRGHARRAAPRARCDRLQRHHAGRCVTRLKKVERVATVVLELTLPNLEALEATMPKVMADKEWHASYEKLMPLASRAFRVVRP